MQLVSVALIVILLVSLVGYIVIATDRLDKIEDLKDDLDIQVNETQTWKDAYLNANDSTVIIWKNDTVYIDRWHNDTIWNNITEYINTSTCDVDRNGVVDVMDAAEVLWYVKYGRTLAEQLVFFKYGNPYEKLYDVNVDGRVNRQDVYFIWEHSD